MNLTKRYEVEYEEDWRDWINKIPYISFPRGWQIKIIPPFAGAIARFLVKKEQESVSIYLDVYNRLGFMDGPYWEVYPVNGDTERCYMDEVQELVKIIAKGLRRPNKKCEAAK